MATETPPRPLPGPDDLRIENPGTIGLLVARWYEWEDWSAAAKLVDALQDHGRMDDAREVRRIVAGYLIPNTGSSGWRWALLHLLMWDVFDWNACCEQMTDVIARREAKLASELANFPDTPDDVLTFEDGTAVPAAEWVGDADDSANNPHLTPVTQIVAFAGLRGFVPRSEAQSPVLNEDRRIIGTETEITLHCITFFEDGSYAPDINSDDTEPAPAGDAVHGD